MQSSKRYWVLACLIIMGAYTTALADRIQLVNGKRAINDKISFTVEVNRERLLNQDPRPSTNPDDVQVFASFYDLPVSGMVYLDGKAIARFDETRQFQSNPANITYGRHTITLAVNKPTSITALYIGVRGGIVREILEGEQAEISLPTGLEQRVVDLERKVQALESELAILRKKRAH